MAKCISCIKDGNTGECRDIKDKTARESIQETRDTLNNVIEVVNSLTGGDVSNLATKDDLDVIQTQITDLEDTLTTLSGVDGGHLATDQDITNLQTQITDLEDIANNMCNPNLLINGDFRVNQRGQTSYTEQNKYTVDRWKLESQNVVVTPTENGITIQNNATGTIYFSQPIEDSKRLFGKIITISTKVNNAVHSRSVLLPTTIPTTNTNYSEYDYGGGSFYLKYNVSKGLFEFTFRVTSGQTKNIEYAKLELGNAITPFNPRPYAEELALCQRYYVRYVPSNSYSMICLGYNNSTTLALFKLSLPQIMRTPPTIRHSNLQFFSGSVVKPITENTISPQGMCGNTLQCEYRTNNLTGGNTNMLRVSDRTQYLEVDAEIY